MDLSQDLLELLKAPDRAELTVQYLVGHLDDVTEDDPPHDSPDAKQEADDTTIEIRQLAEYIVQAKQDPGFRIAPAAIDSLRELVPDRYLDEYFTVQALTSIPGVTARWKQLANLGFAMSPGAKTARYIRQAVSCYRYGMYDAAAVLCRTVLEFSLREALGRRLGKAGEATRTDLDDLITFCARSKVITPAMEDKAHRVRRYGNGAIHTESCEARAAR